MDGDIIAILCTERRRGFCNRCRRFVMWATTQDRRRRVALSDDAEPGEIVERFDRHKVVRVELVPLTAIHTCQQ